MKRRLLDISLSVLSAVLILSIGAGVWLLPSHDFSEEENRALATISPPTLSELTDGSFSASVSDYFRDRIPLRNQFIRLKACSELMLLKGENNGVIFCRDGYLLDRGEYGAFDKAQKNISELSHLAMLLKSNGIPTSIAYVPRGIDVMTDKLPPLYRGNEGEIFDIVPTGAQYTDLLTPLRSAAKVGEYVWFKTDHHWTVHGAYIAYAELSKSLGYTPYEKEYFNIQEMSDKFLGSIYSRAGCVAASPDKLELYRYEGDGDYLLTVDGNQERIGLYFLEYLEKKDKYAVFLGGNYADLSIKKQTDEARPRLLIIKDSYANSLVPFLALHFDIELIDPRYYSNNGELSEKLKNADMALIIQGIDTVAT